MGETLCYVYHEYYGTHTNTIRPFNIYGPGMQELDYRVLPNFTSCIKAGRPLNVYGRGNQTRTFCYLTDAMVGFLKVILNGVPGEACNIGNPEPEITVLELVAAITEAPGRPVEHVVTDYPDSYPADEPMRRCCPTSGRAPPFTSIIRWSPGRGRRNTATRRRDTMASR